MSVTTILLDIETVPEGLIEHGAQKACRAFMCDWLQAQPFGGDAQAWRAERDASYKAPRNYKDPAKLERHRAEFMQAGDELAEAWLDKLNSEGVDAWERTALDHIRGSVVVICAKALDPAGKVLGVFEGSVDGPGVIGDRGDEAALLSSFWGWARTVTQSPICWGGHYASTFDLPALWRRSWLKGVKPPTPPAGWNDVVDTAELWQVTKANRDYVKLAVLAQAFGIGEKLEDDRYPCAWEAVSASDWAWIMARCRSDLDLTVELWRHMTGRT